MTLPLDVTDLGGPGDAFPTTTWTRVLGAKGRDSAGYRDGLDLLIQLYWKPVYWYIRRRWGKSNEDSKDLTQTFFTTFVEKDRLAQLGPEKGRFRTYLRVVLENFLRNSEEAAQDENRREKALHAVLLRNLGEKNRRRAKSGEENEISPRKEVRPISTCRGRRSGTCRPASRLEPYCRTSCFSAKVFA